MSLEKGKKWVIVVAIRKNMVAKFTTSYSLCKNKPIRINTKVLTSSATYKFNHKRVGWDFTTRISFYMNVICTRRQRLRLIIDVMPPQDEKRKNAPDALWQRGSTCETRKIYFMVAIWTFSKQFKSWRYLSRVLKSSDVKNEKPGCVELTTKLNAAIFSTAKTSNRDD